MSKSTLTQSDSLELTTQDLANAEDYLQSLEKPSELESLIIGMDPYPTDANGVAFSKNRTLGKGSSGYKLLCWMIDPNFSGLADLAKMKELRDDKKIGFVNLSQWELIKNAGRKKKEILERDALTNCRLAMNATHVIFVGRTIFGRKYLTQAYSDAIGRGHCFWVPHPAGRHNQWAEFSKEYENYSKFLLAAKIARAEFKYLISPTAKTDLSAMEL